LAYPRFQEAFRCHIRKGWKFSLVFEKFRLEPGRNGCPEIAEMDFFVEIEGGY
jgi:hypothetical protein